MSRTFATLAVTATLLIVTVLVMGLMIGDATSRSEQSLINWHFGLAIAALIGAAFVHAIVLTYFMGTGRWLEETCRAYKLDERFVNESLSLKYRTLPWMCVALVLLVATGSLGCIVDPATPVDWKGFWVLSAAQVHSFVAFAMLTVNLLVNVSEFLAIQRNGRIVGDVLVEVRRIREAHGLPVA